MEVDKNDFQKYLTASFIELEKELKRISQTLKGPHTNFPELKYLQKRLTDSWFGGKMLRGTLVRIGYELLIKNQTDAILKPAAAFEILHTSLLIHDDIIDQSLTRRGKPTLHIHKNYHYGISQAICLGDLGISLSSKLIAESEFPAERKTQAVIFFNDIVNKTILGEMMDVATSQSLKQTEKQILAIYEMKTANYSIVGPLALGAMLAGGNDSFLEKLKLFAEPLGVAYQIQDDILGIFGSEKDLGKSTKSDIQENKNTLLIAHALIHADTRQIKLLKRLYGKKNVTNKEQETIKKILVETGSLAYSQKKIAKLTREAKKYIPFISNKTSHQQLLTQLCDFLLNRKL